MTRTWPAVPGVPAAGHVTARGYWHPGKAEGCAKCEPPRRLCAAPRCTHEAEPLRLYCAPHDNDRTTRR